MRRALRPLGLAAAAAAIVVSSIPTAAVADPPPTALLVGSYLDNYVVDPVSGVATRTPVTGLDAVLSPKRDRVAYTRDVGPCIPTWDGTCRVTFDLVTAKPDGTDERLVLSGGTESTTFGAPDWSPDGKWIVFDAASDPGGGLRGLALVRADGTGFRSLDRLGFRGTFSPDGKQIAYSRQSEVWVLDVATGTTRQLTSGSDTTGSAPDWSPDGKKILFTSYLGNYVNTVDIRDGSVTGLVTWGTPFGVEWAGAAVFSPDGGRVAYTALVYDPNDEEHITSPAVLVLDVARGEPSVLVQQSGSLTDWVRTG